MLRPQQYTRTLNRQTNTSTLLMFSFIKIYLKFLKTLLHVSVIRPSSESLYFLAKITLINISCDIPITHITRHAATSPVLI